MKFGQVIAGRVMEKNCGSAFILISCLTFPKHCIDLQSRPQGSFTLVIDIARRSEKKNKVAVDKNHEKSC